MARSSYPVNQAAGEREPARSVSSQAPNKEPSITHHRAAEQVRELAGARDSIDESIVQKKTIGGHLLGHYVGGRRREVM